MINQRIQALRTEMTKKQIDCYIIPSFDAHQSEYVAEHWKCRQWISGFTGSAGTVVITQDQALLWTDGRYHVQALKQLAGSEFELMKQGLQGVPTIGEWISNHLAEGQTIGFDGKVMAVHTFEALKERFSPKRFKISYQHDLVAPIWADRPSIPQTEVMILDTKYVGKDSVEKVAEIRAEMTKLGGAAYLIPNLDDICWTFNIRGNDIKYNHMVIAYALITQNDAHLFIENSKLPEKVQADLLNSGVTLHAYEEALSFLSTFELSPVLYAPQKTSVALLRALSDTTKLIPKGDIATRLKAIKNPTEIANIRNSQIKDGVAMVQFNKWLNENIPKGIVTELNIAGKLREIRGKQALYIGESFNTIAAYGPNAAMMHYSATPLSYHKVSEGGFLLVDSGAQYYDGTTDITRTYPTGPLTEEQRTDYTLTLKSHIGLAQAKFLKGTCGPHLDVLARKPMWDNGLDYKCGTGHGIGFLLNVHEGPHTIRCNHNDVPLEKGMIISNEPGVYREGKHGVRIENTILVVANQITDFGEFYQFETISYCPIDTTPLIPKMMSPSEIKWINDYNHMTYEKLSPFLNEDERAFLASMTKPIK